MKRLISILLLAVFCISLAACQPTPEESFVVNKGDGKLMEIIGGKPAPALTEPYQADEHWTETLEGRDTDKLLIEIDANVTVPDVLEYPVYDTVFKNCDQAALDEFLLNTVGNVDMYIPNNYESDIVAFEYDSGTKVYFDVDYVNKNEAQILLDAIDYQLNDKDSPYNKYYVPSEESTDAEKQDAGRRLLVYQELYEYVLNHQSEFLTKVDKKYPYSDVSQDKQEEYSGTLWVTDDGQKVFVYHENNIADTLIYQPDGRSADISVSGESIAKNRDLSEITIDRDDAEAKADEWLNKLGLDDWQLVCVGSAETLNLDMELFDIYMYGWTEAEDAGAAEDYDYYARRFHSEEPEAYVFIYAPTKDGIPALYTSNKRNVNAYSYPIWTAPNLKIAVDDTGVRSVELTNGNAAFGTCLNKNVELLPFEKIQEKFRDYITMSPDLTDRMLDYTPQGDYVDVGYYNWDDADHVRTRVHIDDIRLGYIKVKKINTDDYMAIPAWCFFGQEYNSYKPGSGFILDENNEHTKMFTQAGHTFLCINAIDGSIIDLTKGY